MLKSMEQQKTINKFRKKNKAHGQLDTITIQR